MIYLLKLLQIHISSFLFLLIGFIFYMSICEKTYAQSESVDEVYTKIKKMYGEDQNLMNGDFYEYPYKKDLGHPFFLSNDFENGHIVIHDKTYNDIKLKYNIFNESLVLMNYKYSPLAFLPPMGFISEFSVSNHLFRKYHYPDSEEKFYEIIYDGEIKCLYAWQKKRAESHHNVSFSAYRFHDAQKKNFLFINDKLMPYKSKRNFLKLFPKEYKETILKYFKENKISLKHSSDKHISGLITYCEELVINNFN